MELLTVRMEIPKDANLILGHSHFIKTAEDLYEVVVNTVPGAKFAVAFNEASGPCLIRVEANDDELRARRDCERAIARRGPRLRSADSPGLPDQPAEPCAGFLRGLFDFLRDGESGRSDTRGNGARQGNFRSCGWKFAERSRNAGRSCLPPRISAQDWLQTMTALNRWTELAGRLRAVRTRDGGFTTVQR